MSAVQVKNTYVLIIARIGVNYNMDNLTVKSVPFMGSELMAAQQENSKKIFVGVSYICKGIGLSKSQKDTQIQNVQKDAVLSKGCLKFQAGVFDPNNETLALDIDFLPLWLAKITITPSMQKEQPEVADKLIQYQLKAKDALANAFIQHKPMSTLDFLEYTVKAIREQQDAISDTNKRIDSIGEVIALDTRSWREDARRLIVKIAQKRGSNDYIRDTNAEVFKLVDNRGGVSLETRLTNKRRRMAEEGICKSKRDKLNKVDIIADDKKLIEIYVAIVKEMAIKYGIDKKSA